MSNERNDGGPAFPRDHASLGHNGMSLRDYFIAHAPAEPQPWFEPVMCECPAAIYVSHDGRFQYASAEAAASAWGSVGYRIANGSAIEAWEAERAKQRYAQWPAAWADEMLKARQS